MTNPTVNFRKRDLDQAIAVMQARGIEVMRVEIERGKIVIFAGKPGEAPERLNENEWKDAHL